MLWHVIEVGDRQNDLAAGDGVRLVIDCAAPAAMVVTAFAAALAAIARAFESDALADVRPVLG
jgi:hypothetical protein